MATRPGGSYFDSTNLVDELSVAAWPAGAWAASLPLLPAPNRQANQAGFTSSDGRIWSTGGINGSTFQFLADHLYRSSGSAPCVTASATVVGGTPTRTATAGGTATATACVGGWQLEPSMPSARRNPAVAVVGSNLYAISGFNGAPDYTAANEAFNGTTWSTLAPIPTPAA